MTVERGETPVDERTTRWHELLTRPGLAPMAPLFRWLPSRRRCPLCRAPTSNPLGPIMALVGYGRSSRYPQLCNPCFRGVQSYPGGAEVEVTVLFADVRGSTTIAESISPAAFSALLHDFYALVTDAVQAEGGVIDKFLGDGVMALFVPSFTERHDAQSGLAAGKRILAEARLPVGVGVNTGPAFTGFLGPTAEVASFSAVGDAVNVAHRLGEAAAAGELLVAGETVAAAGFEPPADHGRWERRELTVKGRSQPVDVWSLTLLPPSDAAAAA